MTAIDFLPHYKEYTQYVEGKIDEDGWVYSKDLPHILDYYFEANTKIETEFEKRGSRGNRWRPKTITEYFKAKCCKCGAEVMLDQMEIKLSDSEEGEECFGVYVDCPKCDHRHEGGGWGWLDTREEYIEFGINLVEGKEE